VLRLTRVPVHYGTMSQSVKRGVRDMLAPALGRSVAEAGDIPRPRRSGPCSVGRPAAGSPASLAPMQQGFRAQRDKTPFDKLAQAFARTRLGGWLFVNVFPVIDRRLIPLTGGRLAVAVGQPMLLLHTRGARSGQPRSTPLLYTWHGRGYVVVASKAGADHHPAWYYNMRAHPGAVTIEVGGRHIPVRPREAEGPEREELWRLVNDNYNGYQVYQQRAGQRIIPVVLLEPA